MKCRVLDLACLWVAMEAALALCQVAPPQTQVFTTQAPLVIVPALVRTKAGDLLFTLTANDFELTDDGVPQNLILRQLLILPAAHIVTRSLSALETAREPAIRVGRGFIPGTMHSNHFGL